MQRGEDFIQSLRPSCATWLHRDPISTFPVVSTCLSAVGTAPHLPGFHPYLISQKTEAASEKCQEAILLLRLSRRASRSARSLRSISLHQGSQQVLSILWWAESHTVYRGLYLYGDLTSDAQIYQSVVGLHGNDMSSVGIFPRLCSSGLSPATGQ